MLFPKDGIRNTQSRGYGSIVTSARALRVHQGKDLEHLVWLREISIWTWDQLYTCLIVLLHTKAVTFGAWRGHSWYYVAGQPPRLAYLGGLSTTFGIKDYTGVHALTLYGHDRILWGVITYPWPKDLFLAPKSSYEIGTYGQTVPNKCSIAVVSPHHISMFVAWPWLYGEQY